MTDRNEHVFQPLKIYALTEQEKGMVVAALILGKQKGLVVQARLERELGNRSLRYLLNSERTEARPPRTGQSKRKREGVPVAYEKWIQLYDHVMNKLYDRAVKQEVDELVQLIENLYDEGLKTGRYDNDLHLFNSRYLNQNTRNAGFDSRSLGHYVGFRLRSNGTELITSLMQIYSSEKGGRHVFHAKLADPNEDREVRGTVYELAGHIYLLGFLNDGHGGEYYALRPHGRSHDILYGIMATVNHSRTPHAKQCCFIRAERIEGLDLRSSALISKNDWPNIHDQLEFMFGIGSLDIPVRLKNPEEQINLNRYITSTMVFCYNEPQKPKLTGPPG
jgi:hypothetical protein